MEIVIVTVAALLVCGVIYYHLSQKIRSGEGELVSERNRSSEVLAGLNKRLDEVVRDSAELKTENARLNAEVVALKEKNAALSATVLNSQESREEAEALLKSRNSDLSLKLESVLNENKMLEKKISALEESSVQREREYSKYVATLNTQMELQQKAQETERLAREAAEIERQSLLARTWQRHEISVEEKVRMICQRNTIEYVAKEKFPNRGKPDNSVLICDKFVVFDSKSPQGEDLTNFPTYIRTQAEQAKKYVGDDIQADIFFVVPNSAIEVIKDTLIVSAKYRVHIITPDAIEPIMLALQKLEAYEFAENLSPMDRDMIVQILGRMAHNMKRKVQMDQFMNSQAIAILMEAEKLPADILSEARKIERASVLNPPKDGKKSLVDLMELKEDAQKLTGKGVGQDIQMEFQASLLNSIPLHKSPVHE